MECVYDQTSRERYLCNKGSWYLMWLRFQCRLSVPFSTSNEDVLNRKVAEKEESDVLVKRPYLLFETEQEADLADIKQMKKRVEQDRVEVYKKEVF